MTEKQIKFAIARPRRAKKTTDEYSCDYRRPTFESFDDSDRRATRSSRARLISQLVGQQAEHPREFTSYFYGPSRNTDPSYSATSHTKKFARKTVVPTYPSLMHALRWCPNVETSDEEIRANKESNSKCKCANCAMKNCCNKVYQKSVGFRDNIMTFNDQCTMTPKFRDVSCSCAKKAMTTSEVSACVSNVAVKDTYEPPYRPQYVTQKCSPMPILKKSYTDFGINYACNQGIDNYQEAVKEVGLNVDMKPKKVRSIKSFMQLRRKDYGSTRHDVCPRVNIYNEGISDSIANHLPDTPKPAPTQVTVKTGRSRIVLNTPSITDTEVYIPFSHKFDSKYHDSCKKPQTRDYHERDFDEARKLVAGPTVVRKAWKQVNVYKRPAPQCIILPKKVLTSERNIETFINNPRPKLASKNR